MTTPARSSSAALIVRFLGGQLLSTKGYANSTLVHCSEKQLFLIQVLLQITLDTLNSRLTHATQAGLHDFQKKKKKKKKVFYFPIFQCKGMKKAHKRLWDGCHDSDLHEVMGELTPC